MKIPEKSIIKGTGQELMEATFPPTDWIVPNILLEGIALFAGKSKAGKSYFCLQLILEMIRGGEFLEVPLKPRNCYYYALEDSSARLQRRINQLVGENKSSYPYEKMRFDTSDDITLSSIAKDIEDHPNISLVIIDTVMDILRNHKMRDINKYGDVTQALALLKSIAKKYSVCILFTHHTNKKPTPDNIHDSILGSTGFQSKSDTILTLSGGSENVFMLNITGRDVEAKSIKVFRDPKTCRWSLHTSKPVEPTEKERVINYLKSLDQPASPKQISQELKKDVSTVTTMLYRLVKDGVITKAGHGLYQPWHIFDEAQSLKGDKVFK